MSSGRMLHHLSLKFSLMVYEQEAADGMDLMINASRGGEGSYARSRAFHWKPTERGRVFSSSWAKNSRIFLFFFE